MGLTAEVMGGIGTDYDMLPTTSKQRRGLVNGDTTYAPVCAYGMLRVHEPDNAGGEHALEGILYCTGMHRIDSDRAVRTVRRQLGILDNLSRVPFKLWAAQFDWELT